MRWIPACLLVLLLFEGAVFAAPPDDAKDGQQGHWSLRKRSQPSVPRFRAPVQNAWIRNDIDAFILARLAKNGVQPAPEANRRTLIRRLSFDLTGLPPTPAEVDSFVADPTADAYEKLVERLLASPNYGERWGQHWLDVVRYGETEGFEYDRHRPGAWRFRDYVIKSFNQDKPYDRLILEQIAGDELDDKLVDPIDLQVAVGFHRLGAVRRNAGNQNVAFSRNEVLTERIDVVGAVFLGMTVGCARCHDHKFDDIPQVDYYRLQAFLAATQEKDVSLVDAKTEAEWKSQAKRAAAEIKNIQKTLDKLSGDEEKRLREKLLEAEKRMPPPLPMLSSIGNDMKERTPIHILKRGDGDKKGKQVGPRFLSALPPSDAPELPPDFKTPKTVLAKWIADPDHPLTARVMVNRIWQYHFGRGIVETANNFGVNGGLPSHPELLDYLANRFVADGWRIKAMHRLIVNSATYRQQPAANAERGSKQANSTQHSAALSTQHPALSTNEYSGFPRGRLEAEELRDAMLAVSGRLNLKTGGESVIVPLDRELVRLLYAPAQWTATNDPREHDRRSIYSIAKRNLRLPFGEVFDQPDLQTSCARRESSTHALQALELLNGNISNQLADAFAERLRREAGADPASQVDRAYQLIAGRPPTALEKSRAVQFLAKQPLREFALAMFNLNAFIYVN